MPAPLTTLLASLEQLTKSCDQDYQLLMQQHLDAAWLSSYENQRVVNSFLFNYIKIQDKVGSKLLRQFLYETREIESPNIPMIDVLNHLERMGVIESVQSWDQLREIRNIITHEYPEDAQERIENIEMALKGYRLLKQVIEKTTADEFQSMPGQVSA